MRSNSHSEIPGRSSIGSQDKESKRDDGRGPDYLAPKAKEVLKEVKVIVGYRTYMRLIEPALLKGKETIETGMTDEIRRCQMAIEKILEGKDTAVVSSGDAGIYGMAGLILQLLEERKLLGKVNVEVIPGIPALSAAAALLGAPLMHDFAVISLSDLLTPWEVIQSRVEAAAKADFVIVLYNPKSKKRIWQLDRAMAKIREHRIGETPVGLVRNAAREGQAVHITTLSQLDASRVDMLSILLIGNSQTRIMGEKMVTPRGYEKRGLKAQGTGRRAKK